MLETFNAIVWEFRFIIVFGMMAILYGALEWGMAKSRLFALMLQAKRLAKNAVLTSGDAQVDWVVSKAYTILPPVFTLVISQDKLKKIIRYLYNQAKDYVDDGQFNNSI